MSAEKPFESFLGWRGIDATQRVFARQFSALRRAAPRLVRSAPVDRPHFAVQGVERCAGAIIRTTPRSRSAIASRLGTGTATTCCNASRSVWA